jgi:hypothetical protein
MAGIALTPLKRYLDSSYMKHLIPFLAAAMLASAAHAGLSGVTAQTVGTLNQQQLSVTVTADPSESGRSKQLWVAATVPQLGTFFRDAAGQWSPWNGGAIPASLMTTSADSVSLDALGGMMDLRGLVGTTVLVGFAGDANSLLAKGNYAAAYTVADAPANVASLAIDAGPASQNTVLNGSQTSDVAYATVRICVPGTARCVMVDHMQVDTGSEGVRVLKEVLPPDFVAALALNTDASGRQIGECLQYVDGFVWGPTFNGDFTIGGKTVPNMGIQLIDGNFAAIPSQCSSSGGTAENTVASFGANGIIGIGPDSTDCSGSFCKSSGNGQYYACTGTSCVGIAMQVSSTVPNPIAGMAVDNNGSYIELPAVQNQGQASAVGSLVFGIGTQANNGLGSAQVFTTDSIGMITTNYKGSSLTQSYIDSGTSVLVFPDSTITQCAGGAHYFCPSAFLPLTATNIGRNGVSGNVSFTVGNAENFTTGFAALPALAATDPNSHSSFAWGLPFFFGRRVFTALPVATPAGNGPYFAY